MTVDICVPIYHKNLDLFLKESAGGVFSGSLIDLIDHTNIPFRIIVLVDGGVRNDIAVLERYLLGLGQKWTLLHESQPIYYSRCVDALLKESSGDLVVVMPPEVSIEDDSWFGKIQFPFVRDPNAMVAFADSDEGNTLPPNRLPTHFHPESPMFMVTGYTAKELPRRSSRLDAGQFAAAVSEWARDYGGNRWSIPGMKRSIKKSVSHGRPASQKARA